MALKACVSASHIGTLVLPNSTAPAPISRSTESAFESAMQSRNSGTPQVVGIPFTSKESLTVIGTPWSGPQLSPLASARSAARARRRAAGMSVSTIAFSAGLKRSTRAR